MVDIRLMTPTYLEAWPSGSVLTETQLRSLWAPYVISHGTWIVIPVTLTSGDVALANFDSSVWPAWIRQAIKQKLLDAGGVPSALPLEVTKDGTGKSIVQPVRNQVSSSPATNAEHVTDDDDPPSSPTS